LEIAIETTLPSRYKESRSQYVDQLYENLRLPDGIEADGIMSLENIGRLYGRSLSAIIQITRNSILSDAQYSHLRYDPRTLSHYISISIKNNYVGGGNISDDTAIRFIGSVIDWNLTYGEDDEVLKGTIQEAFRRFKVPVSQLQLNKVLDYYRYEGEEFRNIFTYVMNDYDEVRARMESRYRGRVDDVSAIKHEYIMNTINLRIRELIIEYAPHITVNSIAYEKYRQHIIERLGLQQFRKPILRSPPIDNELGIRRRSPIHYDRYEDPEEWMNRGPTRTVTGTNILDVTGFNLISMRF
jgi:hypothetical protein